ncbi:S1 family peptidase [Saccharopolyspora gloriosae]|uniref:Streptogrisin C n=1 Tax=Saccharopolyspora gloriosae TaxID=455344 RepID=A0A840NN92_9PSEU|nr:S1 family peptidase [Saccharopolyspora gloriosae]MBB5071798.1 streptogrisin C [Saccharopolyspora gloriosae]
MSRKRTLRLTGAALLAAGTVTAWAMPAVAAPPPQSPELITAMQRDFGLTAQQAQTRLAQEDAARDIDQQVRGSLGAAFGGAHFDAELGKLVVGVTDAAKLAEVRSTGAQARVVAHSSGELDAVKAELDSAESTAPASVTGWYVDEIANTVVVNVREGARDAATETYLADVAADAPIRVDEVAEAPRTLYDLVGGQAFYMGGGRCSVGFPVRTSSGGFGMVTAGHCGTPGTSASGYNQAALGSFQGSSFPGNDYAWVSANSSWTARPWVDMYNGSARVVTGHGTAPAGSSICRSGSTTGWHCGSVQALNQTVRYAEGAVSGLTQTNVCAEPGDSGGSFISGNQAQGMTSGGSGNCSSGGTTYFQPVGEALSAYGLSLVTG